MPKRKCCKCGKPLPRNWNKYHCPDCFDSLTRDNPVDSGDIALPSLGKD